MIHAALTLLKEELNGYIRSQPAHTDPNYVQLGNVATLDEDNQNDLRNMLIISIVNVEEESTLKNIPSFQKTANGKVRYEHPPIHLNLYVVFSAYFPENYDNALIRLSQTIRFFQSKHSFNVANTSSATIQARAMDPDDPQRDDLASLEILLDLYTMTFEQINHLWGSLGGKQIPFAMYRARLVKMRDPIYRAEAPLIEEIQHEEQLVQKTL